MHGVLLRAASRYPPVLLRTPSLGLRFRSGGPKKSRKRADAKPEPPRPPKRLSPSRAAYYARQTRTPELTPPPIPQFTSHEDTLLRFRELGPEWARTSAARERLVSFGVSLDDARKLLSAYAAEIEGQYFDDPLVLAQYPVFKLGGADHLDADIVHSQTFFKWIKTRAASQLGPSLQDAIARLTKISEAVTQKHVAEGFERARSIRRTFIMHVGPTNSGKTYHALRALAGAKTGIYCGPLRLLAHEIWERLNLGQVAPLWATPEQIAEAAKIKSSVNHPFARECNMLTGEEIKVVKDGAPLSSCTIEMLALARYRDVAVIDEIQMIADPFRGSAWTLAVMGLFAKEIHLCGEDTAVPLIQKLVEETGDELIIRRYERLTPLIVEEESLDGDTSRLQQGDAIVTFSRTSIFALKAKIERETPMKCATIYGNLPPEIRSQQAALFNAGNTGYDVLIGSDAIGMGLNLKIRRIIFDVVSKYDGSSDRLLSTSQIKQIAGRAGRFGMQNPGDKPGGFVTTLRSEDLPVVQRSLPKPNTPVRYARLPIETGSILLVSALLPKDASTQTIFSAHMYAGELPDNYMPRTVPKLDTISEFLDTRDLSLASRSLMMEAPFPWREFLVQDAITKLLKLYDDNSFVGLQKFLEDVGFDERLRDVENAMRTGAKCNGEPFQPSRELRNLEAVHKMIVVYVWLSFRDPIACAEFDLAQEIKTRLEKALHWCLEEMTFESGGQAAKGKGKDPMASIEFAPRRKKQLVTERLEERWVQRGMM
ncbi:ATP-dependent RNA helicase [Mycena chlorophos]|uniref:RNA helicase n=1 Tax=Mycena chlorophos TaxID=658473 RepID=A0A8H6TQK1_MYCCL|nr:ATP-dependent RNA helicase [Mycena chlorophos]